MKGVIITGASKGIGASAAELFAKAGYRVLNLSRSALDQESVENLAVDLSDPTAVEALEQPLAKFCEGLDAVSFIHCAGWLNKDTIQTLSAQDLAGVLQVNVVAASQIIRLLAPHLSPGSSILLVGSTLGEKAVPGAASYATSKHALIGLMRATCQDFAGTGVHTACVCPGFTNTEMLRTHVGQDQEILDAIASGVTFGRLIESEEIARTLVFCAENPVINGAVLHANLGQIER